MLVNLQNVIARFRSPRLEELKKVLKDVIMRGALEETADIIEQNPELLR